MMMGRPIEFGRVAEDLRAPIKTIAWNFDGALPRAGRYAAAMAFPSTGNMATNVPVKIAHADGEAAMVVDQHQTPPFAFVPLGEYRFEPGKPASVTLSNQGTDGGVTADTVRWVWPGV